MTARYQPLMARRRHPRDRLVPAEKVVQLLAEEGASRAGFGGFPILWSDHGFHLGENQHWVRRTLGEKSTRVPFLFAGPGIEPGKPRPGPDGLLDIYPTLVELCRLPKNSHLAGISLVPPAERSRDPMGTAGDHVRVFWQSLPPQSGLALDRLRRRGRGTLRSLNRPGRIPQPRQRLHPPGDPRSTRPLDAEKAAPEFKAKSERNRARRVRAAALGHIPFGLRMT